MKRVIKISHFKLTNFKNFKPFSLILNSRSASALVEFE